MHDTLFSVVDASKTLGIGKTSLYALINRGDVKTVRLGRRRLVLASSIDALIERSTAEMEG